MDAWWSICESYGSGASRTLAANGLVDGVFEERVHAGRGGARVPSRETPGASRFLALVFPEKRHVVHLALAVSAHQTMLGEKDLVDELRVRPCEDGPGERALDE